VGLPQGGSFSLILMGLPAHEWAGRLFHLLTRLESGIHDQA
jgi:hypothetical protein